MEVYICALSLAGDRHLVYLTRNVKGRNQYINAVYLPVGRRPFTISFILSHVLGENVWIHIKPLCFVLGL